MYEILKTLVATKFKVPPAEIVPGVRLTDLDLDSLDMVELSLAIEQELGVRVSDDELVEAGGLDEVVDLIASRTATV